MEEYFKVDCCGRYIIGEDIHKIVIPYKKSLNICPQHVEWENNGFKIEVKTLLWDTNNDRPVKYFRNKGKGLELIKEMSEFGFLNMKAYSESLNSEIDKIEVKDKTVHTELDNPNLKILFFIN